MKQKVALITGIAGQDGSYLSELLLNKNYKIFGIKKQNSDQNKYNNIRHILNKIKFVSADLLIETSLIDAIKKTKPDEIYNLAAQSSVAESWKNPIHTGEITALGAIRLLESIRKTNNKIKFYQASSSEIFGGSKKSPQNEETCPNPKSPYGAAKLYAHWMVKNYRETYNMFAVSGILFNHESPRRGLEYVTRKITHEAVKIKLGMSKELKLGNLDAEKDWGFAGDYVEAMWLMLQQENPKDFVIGTGKIHSVLEFVTETFNFLKLDWKNYVKIDASFLRPAETNLLIADITNAKKTLKWKPKINFKNLIKMMVAEELNFLSKNK
ncbi:GDP-mannose 4,6-dehydratase [Candidatus Parcubacteria bacterium]|nr:GDP-mannose 4,6-dehydratase [Patescibacteria group bacterium]MCG2686989.1 GDP-mannose 4,6-dehydratase [Candidatus Parcubacteria bacterium]